ncbi:aminotransferase [Actinacidiphila oryziradicis]|uniref:aminotransferase n=1 Tax=Actinacidiphila oryziradicis TaxID=2571141 RepID=UPI001FE24559|nr:aminotransferase [Actinacidiphila oryziradicis]
MNADSTSNFFDHPALPAPRISTEQARDVARDLFGVDGPIRSLGSQQDANFLVTAEDGTRYVLKVSNPAFARPELLAQDAAVAHIASGETSVRVPQARRGTDGHTVQRIVIDGQELRVRLLDYLDGHPLTGGAYLSPDVVAALGATAGRISLALRDFSHPGAERVLQWDVRHALPVVEQLAEHVRGAGRADQVRAAARRARRIVSGYADRLPMQVIHGDITDDNVVCRPGPDGRARPEGVIDFGDLMRSWAVGDLAVTCSSLLHHYGASPASTVPAVRAFHRVRPLAEAEVDVVWPLVVLRAAVLVVSGHHSASIDAGNDYAVGNLDHEWTIFQQAVSVPMEVMTAVLRRALGLPLPRAAACPEPQSALLPLVGGPTATLDLSVTSEQLDGGRWTDPDAERAIAEAALRDGAGAAVTRYGERRLTRSRRDSVSVPPTVALAVEVHLSGPTPVHAPWSGEIDAGRDGALVVRSDGAELLLGGLLPAVSAGEPVMAGQLLGEVAGADGAPVLRVQLSTLRGLPVPGFTTPELAAGWEAVCPDPTTLLGTAPALTDDTGEVEGLLRRRSEAFATVQEHYYREPPRIERGWRHHLLDTDGRAYLDMINNVAVLGHGHPRLAAAVARQLHRLNTNSRFHYGAVVELSERLAAALPAPLDTVFLVNSGTEANDLALRLAWAWAGRREVVAVREAYHGWSDATDAISTSVADNPDALGTRPGWVHTVPAPNSYRGAYRRADTARYGQEAAASIRDLTAQGLPPAAFIAEPYYGNAGGMALPDGYLAGVYEAVREAGGLCVADEVQVGFGRLGEYFWGFEQQGVVPDVVTVAKAMGNGHPLGAVITRRDIAEHYRSEGYFFSSAGGSPVSSVVGLTVMDILRDEKLQENARTVGAHLRSRLLELADRHPLIGAVHGTGLYVGVELVRDHQERTPAPEETAAICERMRELGVIVQPTSDRMCVLKIKPPLCLTRESADFFVDTLDSVLREGW